MIGHTTLITFIILNRIPIVINISLYIRYVPLEGWLIREDDPGQAKSIPYNDRDMHKYMM